MPNDWRDIARAHYGDGEHTMVMNAQTKVKNGHAKKKKPKDKTIALKME